MHSRFSDARTRTLRATLAAMVFLAILIFSVTSGVAQVSPVTGMAPASADRTVQTDTAPEVGAVTDLTVPIEGTAADPDSDSGPPIEDAEATAEVMRERAAKAAIAAVDAEQAAARAEAQGNEAAAKDAAMRAADAREEAEEAATRAEAQQAVADAVDENLRDAETGLPVEVLNPGIDTRELELRLVPLTKDELASLAEVWFAIVRQKTEEVMAAQVAILRTEAAVASAARDKLTELVEARKSLFDKASKVASAWEKKGGADEPRLAEMRAYRAAIIVEETRTADVQTLIAQATAWVIDRDGGIQLGIDIIVIIASLVGLWFVARVIRRIAARWLRMVPNLSKLLQVFLVAVIYWVVFAIGLMVVLSGLGIDISPVFALIGGASFILAFAFQDTLGNLASGLMIMINRPFDEGDYVDVGGTAGTVKSVSIVATTVTTPDNQVIVIPNKNVWGNTITNVTASSTRRVDFIFGISYDDDIRKAMAVMETTVKSHPLVLADPEPVIRVHELADSSVNFICRPWTRTGDYWTVYWDLMQQVKEAFDAAGISIPYPQQDVYMHQVQAKPAPLPEPADRDRTQPGSDTSGYAKNDGADESGDGER